MLADIPGLDLTMTTNGALLPQKAGALAAAGLDRITVSLDALEDEVFRSLNDVDFPVARVLAGIDAAAAAGLPVKVNMVVKRGVNEDSVLPMARFFHGSGHTLRFIEYMDVGHTNGWRLDDVVPAAEILAAIQAELPLEPLEPSYRGEVARRWRYADGSGEIGVIASVTQPFCGDCTRARLSADGSLYTCLFATKGHDVRALLRQGAGGGKYPPRSARSGGGEPTATPSSERPRPLDSTRSRCRTSAADESARDPYPPRLARIAGCATHGSSRVAGAICSSSSRSGSDSSSPTRWRAESRTGGRSRPSGTGGFVIDAERALHSFIEADLQGVITQSGILLHAVNVTY